MSASVYLDNKLVKQTDWRPVSQQCWDLRFTLDLDRVWCHWYLIFLSAAEALCCQIELIGWMADWVIIGDVFFIKWCLRNYELSEVETLCVSRVGWEVDAHFLHLKNLWLLSCMDVDYFLTEFYKSGSPSNMWQSLVTIGQATLESRRRKRDLNYSGQHSCWVAIITVVFLPFVNWLDYCMTGECEWIGIALVMYWLGHQTRSQEVADFMLAIHCHDVTGHWASCSCMCHYASRWYCPNIYRMVMLCG